MSYDKKLQQTCLSVQRLNEFRFLNNFVAISTAKINNFEILLTNKISMEKMARPRK